jgi:hypothetical protein
MATPLDIARELLGSVATETTIPLALRWIDARYKQLASRVRFRHLRSVESLTVPDLVNAGTVTISKGSTSVVGTATTWGTSPGVFSTTSRPLWFLRVNGPWYPIVSITNNTHLTLGTAWAEASVANSNYTIARRYHSLPSRVRWLGTFSHPSSATALGYPVSMRRLDLIDPARTQIASPPRYVAQRGTDTAGNILIEIYPIQPEATLIVFNCWLIPSNLSPTADIPPQIDPYILREGAYIDFCRYMMARRDSLATAASAELWRYEMHTAETRWEAYIQEASRTDRADSADRYIETRFGATRETVEDIKTATDEWWLYRK